MIVLINKNEIKRMLIEKIYIDALDTAINIDFETGNLDIVDENGKKLITSDVEFFVKIQGAITSEEFGEKI